MRRLIDRATATAFTKFFFLVVAVACAVASHAQNSLEIDGYVKLLGTGTNLTEEIPSVFLSAANLEYTYFDYQIHNRFNFEYRLGEHWRAKAGMRNRLFWGYQTENLDVFQSSIDSDPGRFDLSYVWFETDGMFLHTILDRAYIEYRTQEWEFTAGRQRINWGVNTVWNPNDLFNQYNYFDFDYEERPGSDAVRFTRYLSYNSKIETAASVDSVGEVTAAGLYQFGMGTYDVQVVAGWFKDDIALGGGWAGNLKNAGFKGEFTYFHGVQNESPNAFLASVTVDYAFANSLYLAGSYLYNSAGSNESNFADFGAIAGPGTVLSAKNPFPFKSTLFVASSYQITPLFRVDLSQMVTTNFDSYILIPSLSYSITQDLDALILAQVFFGNRAFTIVPTLPPADFGWGYVSGLGFVRLKYSF
ncbi:MAG: hypothetical protein J4F31_08165 [Flavobacteriales bacterium]|nr:hypothetical protein [Flavobacteriales bacterium]